MSCESSQSRILTAIKEANALKADTEKAIDELLCIFTQATGLAVDQVSFNRIDLLGGASRYHSKITVNL